MGRPEPFQPRGRPLQEAGEAMIQGTSRGTGEGADHVILVVTYDDGREREVEVPRSAAGDEALARVAVEERQAEGDLPEGEIASIRLKG